MSEKAARFVELQMSINNQIDKHGEASLHDVMTLEVLGSILTKSEIEEVCLYFDDPMANF